MYLPLSKVFFLNFVSCSWPSLDSRYFSCFNLFVFILFLVFLSSRFISCLCSFAFFLSPAVLVIPFWYFPVFVIPFWFFPSFCCSDAFFFNFGFINSMYFGQFSSLLTLLILIFLIYTRLYLIECIFIFQKLPGFKRTFEMEGYEVWRSLWEVGG